MNYVIIGNSVAAVGAIRGIRTHDTEGTITVISRENHVAYGRPLISYLLGGTITEKRMSYLPDDFYDKNRVNLLLGSEVVAVDSDKKRVKLASGDTIPFDKLLVATGGDPFVPPIEGMSGKEKVFTFTTWDDAAKLKDGGTTEHEPFKSGDCLSCHNPHTSDYPTLLVSEGNSLCVSCHDDKSQVPLYKHAAVTQGRGCISCHKPHAAKNKRLLIARGADLCYGCHLKTKEALKASKVIHPPFAEGDCESCHNPHGSTQDKLLVGSTPKETCTRCHMDLL